MVRKLILTGGVLMIPDHNKMLRVLLALTISFAFLAAQITIKPFRRPEDDYIAMLTHFALVLLYLAVSRSLNSSVVPDCLPQPRYLSERVPIPRFHRRCCSSRRATFPQRFALSSVWGPRALACSSFFSSLAFR